MDLHFKESIKFGATYDLHKQIFISPELAVGTMGRPTSSTPHFADVIPVWTALKNINFIY